MFMIFCVIIGLVQGWSRQGWKYASCPLSQNLNFKVDLDTHFRDKHGQLFLWYLELVWPSFKVGQTKVENMHFCGLSQNWNFTVYLDTQLGDNHSRLSL